MKVLLGGIQGWSDANYPLDGTELPVPIPSVSVAPALATPTLP